MVLAAGCGWRAEPPPIVLISIDTLRSDRLPVYGYEGVRTPGIDRLAADAIVFERAFSNYPLTLPSHASMLSGLLPPGHGVRSNLGYRFAGEDLPSLPRSLGRLGYATGAAVSSFVLRRETGIDEGFDFFDDAIQYQAGVGSAGSQRPGVDTLAAALPWLRSHSDRPFFLFLHLYEPHKPWAPPADLAALYPDPYDGEVAAADRIVVELISELRELGRYEDSVIVLTSDHGEGLGDHGEEGHGVLVYRESLQVPLILKLPGSRSAGTRVAAPAQLVDLFPTLLELAGGRAEGSDGTFLLDLAAEPVARSLYAESYYPRFYYGWSQLRSLFDGRYQYIESSDPELFDVESDPEQRVNIVAEERAIVARLRRQLAAIDERLTLPTPADEETRRKLASLGYVHHGQSTHSRPAMAPQTQTHLLADLMRAQRHAAAGEVLLGIGLLEEILEANPLMLRAWEQLAKSYEHLGRPQEALAAYRKAIELAETAPHLRLSAARLGAATGELDEARANAEAALPWDEGSARASLAQIALAAGDLTAAEREARAALAVRSPNMAATLSLARVKMARGAVQEALALTDEVDRETDKPGPNFVLLRATLLVRLGRLEEAERELRQEIDRYPSGLRAYSRLALMLARHGRTQESVTTVRRLVETNPTAAGFAAAARTLADLGDPDSGKALARAGLARFPDSRALQELSG